jgi:DNA-binding transcriptional ArsR family regulator
VLTILLDGEISVSPLCALVGLSQSALSQHLAKLRRAGLVSFRRNAQTIYYSCDSNTVKRILEMMDTIFPPAAKPAQAA